MIVTTKEQSLALMKSGLDADTADLAWVNTPCNGSNLVIRTPLCKGDVPIWSMGQLWKIMHNSGIIFYEYGTCDPPEEVVDSLFEAVERAARNGRLR